MLLEHILHQSARHRYRHKAHYQPGHAALGQVPFQDNPDKIGIEDDGIDNDRRRQDEVQDKLQHLGRLVHFVFAVGNQRAAHLRGNDEPYELPQVGIEILGFIDAEDVEEGAEDGQECQRDDTRNDESEEQLRHHMQGMGSKTAVVHTPRAHHEQDGCQHISETEAVCPEERLQVEHHQRQEQESRNHVSPAVHLVQPEGKHQQWYEQHKDVFINSADHLVQRFIPLGISRIPGGNGKEGQSHESLHRKFPRTAQQ